jgi:uncharacterized protein YnzC (UPF0291/DUF896 family)
MIKSVGRQVTALRKEEIDFFREHRKVRVPDFLRLVDESGDDIDGGVRS